MILQFLYRPLESINVQEIERVSDEWTQLHVECQFGNSTTHCITTARSNTQKHTNHFTVICYEFSSSENPTSDSPQTLRIQVLNDKFTHWCPTIFRVSPNRWSICSACCIAKKQVKFATFIQFSLEKPISFFVFLIEIINKNKSNK